MRLANSLLAILFYMALPAQATQLQGRIEEIIENPDVKMPVEQELQIPDKPHTLQANSFPLTLKGLWGGKLQISKSLFSKTYRSLAAEDVAKEEQVVVAGGQADSSFSFSTRRDGTVTMEPPEIKIRVPGTSWLRPHYVYIAIADFNSGYQNMSGDSTVKSALLQNDVRMLSATVVEQDTVIQQVLTEKSTGKQKITFGETVYRFTKTRPHELHTQVAQVQYGSDGSWWEKVLLEGDLH